MSDNETAADIVRNLPAIAEDRIKLCAGCGDFIINKGMTFWMISPIRAGLDSQGLKERVGLSMMMGGNAALGSMFAGAPAARVVDQGEEICVCEECAMSKPLAVLALGS